MELRKSRGALQMRRREGNGGMEVMRRVAGVPSTAYASCD